MHTRGTLCSISEIHGDAGIDVISVAGVRMLDVHAEPAGIDAGTKPANPVREDDMSDDSTATVEASLRLGNGFAQDERGPIVEGWASLDTRLQSFDAGTVELELSVKERGEPSQRTVLEAWISGQTRIVATSNEPDLAQALHEVRDELIRQLTDAKNRTEPRNNPSLRITEVPER